MKSAYEIRNAEKADAEAIANVHLNSWKTTYGGIVSQAYLDNLSLANLLELRKKIQKNNSGVHLVATFNGKVIAFYDADSFRFHINQIATENQMLGRNERGEILAIYILKEHQHLGVGRALFQVGAGKLKECGLVPFIAWVLKDNRQAIRFYEAMGGELVDEVAVTIGDTTYIEIAYRYG